MCYDCDQSKFTVAILGGMWYNCHQCQTSVLPFLEVCAIIVISVKLHCCHFGGYVLYLVICVEFDISLTRNVVCFFSLCFVSSAFQLGTRVCAALWLEGGVHSDYL